MNSQEFIDMLATHYRDFGADETISIGHWRNPGIVHPDLPDFCADIAVSIGELRKMSSQPR